MSEASNPVAEATTTAVKQSAAAKKLASDFNLTEEELNAIEPSGPSGLITKDDILAFQSEKAKTNIMENQKLEKAKAVENDNVPVTSEVVAIPSQEELLKIIQEMQGEITQLRETQAGLVERDRHSYDLTDELFFISKPNAHRWEERRVIDNKTVAIEFVGTGFYGPFNNRDEIEEYLEAKRAKREDSFIDWQGVDVMTGREARLLDQKEEQERESQFSSSAPVNVLDRRIFAAKHQGHVPGQGRAMDDPDKAGPAPYMPSNG